MDHRRTYWLYQILGWTAYAAVGLTFTIMFTEPSPRYFVTHALFALYGIGLTHAFRYFIHRRQPHAGRVFLGIGILLISVIQVNLVVFMDVLLGGEPWPMTSALSVWWGCWLVAGVWTILYMRITEKRRRDEREAQLQLAAREAELRALQYQVNPHFLFNSLNSIRALVLENPSRAQDMLTRLSSILRHNLSGTPAHTVALETEISAVSDYLALEAVRFEERLRVRFDIDPSLHATQVPPLLLQTLVENAIKHGIAQTPAGGDLVIRAMRHQDSVRLEVENTGKLEQTPGDDQFGLSNARQRLALIYGSRAALELKAAMGHVTALVSIPA